MNIPAKKEVGNNDGVANGGKDVKGMRILKDKDGGGRRRKSKARWIIVMCQGLASLILQKGEMPMMNELA